MDNIGENIKAARKKCGMTQGQLASQLGLTKAAVSRYELGQRNANLPLLEKIAKVTGVYIGDLVGADYWNHVPDHEVAASFAEDPAASLAASLFGKLNKDGQQRAIEYLEMLNDSEKYKRLEK